MNLFSWQTTKWNLLICLCLTIRLVQLILDFNLSPIKIRLITIVWVKLSYKRNTSFLSRLCNYTVATKISNKSRLRFCQLFRCLQLQGMLSSFQSFFYFYPLLFRTATNVSIKIKIHFEWKLTSLQSIYPFQINTDKYLFNYLQDNDVCSNATWFTPSITNHVDKTVESTSLLTGVFSVTCKGIEEERVKK